MKTILFSLCTTLAAGFTAVLTPVSALADSTADLVLNLQCRGGYDVQIWRDYNTDALLYRSQGPLGNLELNGGTVQATEGTQVYRFQNDSYQYWVWDGTLDSQDAGTLEVYQNNRILMQEPCRKI